MLTRFWFSPHWEAYERATHDAPGTRARLLAAAQFKTRVLDLSVSEGELWRGVAKTMRQAVVKGEKLVSIHTHPRLQVFQDYKDVHQRVFTVDGVLPRPKETYDCQEQWVREGHAFAVVGHDDDGPCAACFIVRWLGWAYYWSGPSLRRNVMPALLWRAIRDARGAGDLIFEIGWVGHATDQKGKQIEWFKTRWGGCDTAFVGPNGSEALHSVRSD